MYKTEIDVEQDFFNAIRESALMALVKGGIYKKEMRPFDSKEEDIIVMVSSLTMSQRQEGVMTILVYVPMVEGRSNGELLPDKKRIGFIEKACCELPSELVGLMPEYDGIDIYSSLTSHVDRGEELSYVSLKIKFSYLTI